MAKTAIIRSRSSPRDLYRPVAKAYVLTYIFVLSPQLIRPITSVVTGRRSVASALSRAFDIFKQTARLEAFPACAAILIFASTAAPRLVADALSALRSTTDAKRRALLLQNQPLVRFLAVFIAALGVFRLINKPSPAPAKPVQKSVPETPAVPDVVIAADYFGVGGPYDHVAKPITANQAGKTIFTTSFAAVNALVVLSSALFRSKYVKSDANRTALTTRINDVAPAASVIVSSAIIMFQWFYNPSSLPRDYVAWITSVARLDNRLADAVRGCRTGEVKYGSKPTIPCHLDAMAKDMGYPAVWGDPVKTIPIPCELVHAGLGPSCEYHALTRFISGWILVMKIYLPLNLIIFLRRNPRLSSLRPAFTTASRSASFIGGFIALFYYGVCLTRSRLGPLILGTSKEAYQRMDGGAAIAAGSLACGWSILLEKNSKREEMALFVAPRALSSILPQAYDAKYLWREQLVFAASTATILAAVDTAPSSLRGVFGRLLRQVYA